MVINNLVKKRGIFLSIILCTATLLFSNCSLFDLLFPVPEEEKGITPIVLEQVWKIEHAWPDLRDISMSDKYLFIPLFTRGGLLCADIETGEVLWRYEEMFQPITPALMYKNTIFILGNNPDNGEKSFYIFSLEEGYKGRCSLMSIPNTNPGIVGNSMYEIDGNLYWGAWQIHVFDAKTEFIEISEGVFDPAGHHSVIYTAKHDSGSVCVIGDTILPYGEDCLLFTKEIVDYRDENYLVCINRETGETVWEYETTADHLYSGNNLLLINDETLLLCGVKGWDLMNPKTQTSYWTITDPELLLTVNPIIVGGSIYSNRSVREGVLNETSIKDGKRLFTVDYDYGGIHQTMQEKDGILYLSAIDAVVLFDTKTNKFIGRDKTHPGYSQQVNTTLKYKDLFIHFCDDIDAGGYVEALRMDYKR